MNRLTPRMRRAGLLLAVLLPLLVLPAVRIAGRSQTLHPLVRNAARIAAALRPGPGPRLDSDSPASSTEVFNRLIQAGKVDERTFYVPGFEPLKRRPNGDGVLAPEENCFALVTGLPREAAGSTPWLLWDPALRDKRILTKQPLQPPRWLFVDISGRVSLQDAGRWEEQAGGDLLPVVPGEQRLLRP